MAEYPKLLHTVLDSERPRELAEFYRQLLGVSYDPVTNRRRTATPDEADWLVLVDAEGCASSRSSRWMNCLRSTWPKHDVPRQLHVDYTVSSAAELARQRVRAEALGARVLLDRTDDPDEALFVFADLSGHPFCIFVA